MRKLLICLFLGLAAHLAAQQPDTLPAGVAHPFSKPPSDTLRPVLDTAAASAASASVSPPAKKRGFVHRIFTKNYPNPRTAALLSLALPGTGQIYNKKWWKLPLVYGALGAMTYFEIDNIREYHRLRDNYKLLVDGDPNTNPTEEPYTRIDATSMKQYRDQWRRYVDLTSLGLGLTYVLAATEAFVDAHLTRFDVSDDLSLRLLPKALVMPDAGLAFGVGVRLEFGGSDMARKNPNRLEIR